MQIIDKLKDTRFAHSPEPCAKQNMQADFYVVSQ